VNPDDDPLEALDATLAAGGSLIFFPEGTRGSGRHIQPFKSGLYHLAARHPQVTLVPVYIENLNRVLPKGEFLPVPIICTVRFGAGFRLDPAETSAGFIARAQSLLEGLVPT
jgi:1-acyl-sn-glycerol-3-phosphate acyltransferase